MENVARFNRLSHQRNRIFVEKLRKRMEEKKTNVAVLVAGGYHSQGVEELLKQKNVSFITIRPRMDAGDFKEGYHPLNAFKASSLPLEKLFLPEKVSIVRAQTLGSGETFGLGDTFALANGIKETVTDGISDFRKGMRGSVKAGGQWFGEGEVYCKDLVRHGEEYGVAISAGDNKNLKREVRNFGIKLGSNEHYGRIRNIETNTEGESFVVGRRNTVRTTLKRFVAYLKHLMNSSELGMTPKFAYGVSVGLPLVAFVLDYAHETIHVMSHVGTREFFKNLKLFLNWRNFYTKKGLIWALLGFAVARTHIPIPLTAEQERDGVPVTLRFILLAPLFSLLASILLLIFLPQLFASHPIARNIVFYYSIVQLLSSLANFVPYRMAQQLDPISFQEGGGDPRFSEVLWEFVTDGYLLATWFAWRNLKADILRATKPSDTRQSQSNPSSGQTGPLLAPLVREVYEFLTHRIWPVILNGIQYQAHVSGDPEVGNGVQVSVVGGEGLPQNSHFEVSYPGDPVTFVVSFMAIFERLGYVFDPLDRDAICLEIGRLQQEIYDRTDFFADSPSPQNPAQIQVGSEPAGSRNSENRIHIVIPSVRTPIPEEHRFYLPDGEWKTFGRQGNGQDEFVLPQGLAVDWDGNLWAADLGNNRVQMFGPSQEYKSSFDIEKPISVAISPEGVVWLGGRFGFLTYKKDQIVGTPIADFYRQGGVLAFDSDGFAYVIDFTQNRIAQYEKGTGIKGYLYGGKHPFSGLSGIAIDSEDRIYTSESMVNRIQMIDMRAGETMVIPSPPAPLKLDHPEGLAVDSEDRLWVANGGGNNVLIYDPRTESWAVLDRGVDAPKLNWPKAIAFGHQGQAYVSDSLNHRIQFFSPNPPNLPDQAGELEIGREGLVNEGGKDGNDSSSSSADRKTSQTSMRIQTGKLIGILGLLLLAFDSHSEAQPKPLSLQLISGGEKMEGLRPDFVGVRNNGRETHNDRETTPKNNGHEGFVEGTFFFPFSGKLRRIHGGPPDFESVAVQVRRHMREGGVPEETVRTLSDVFKNEIWLLAALLEDQVIYVNHHRVIMDFVNKLSPGDGFLFHYLYPHLKEILNFSEKADTNGHAREFVKILAETSAWSSYLHQIQGQFGDYELPLSPDT
ncbi:MAG: NHL repeat-containing protein, partial [Elusimicrobia bacterium]|nr:NHL repeat-containing protein [Elusimicrobiota bacterium]